MHEIYNTSITKQFNYYKLLGEQAMAQLTDEQLLWQYNEGSNSIAKIVQHLHGNMISRWTDFLTTDGEKENRNRDAEFETVLQTRAEIMNAWEAGWACFFNAIASLKEEDLSKTIYIRNQGQTVVDAINRQLAHYPYHVGQIIFICKLLTDDAWKSLSIPKNKSAEYNAERFAAEKRMQHFTDDTLNKK
jgi:Protein of unknown function (DUF1572)